MRKDYILQLVFFLINSLASHACVLVCVQVHVCMYAYGDMNACMGMFTLICSCMYTYVHMCMEDCS